MSGGGSGSGNPLLIEPGVKYFLNETLKQCRLFKNEHYNFLYNIALLVSLLILLGTILLIKYKGKMTPSEMHVKNAEKQQYILSKIKNYQQARENIHQNLITGLPHWQNEYDSVRRTV